MSLEINMSVFIKKKVFAYINKCFAAKETYSADCLTKDSEESGGGFVWKESKCDKKRC